LFVKLNSIL